MDKLYFEVPTIERKKDAIEYLNEHYEYKSNINGTGGLHKYLDNYEGWLEKLESDYTTVPTEERVPARTFFLVRESDNRIVGMINIRTALNDKLRQGGGHIGYGIRQTERGKGYNKVNLYLGLKVCAEYGINKVLMDASFDNPASWKTMESFDGIRVKEWFDKDDSSMTVNYEIDVKNALEKYKDVYEPYIGNNKSIKSKK